MGKAHLRIDHRTVSWGSPLSDEALGCETEDHQIEQCELCGVVSPKGCTSERQVCQVRILSECHVSITHRHLATRTYADVSKSL
jgi:hypothetical protein